jgi:hypothetical protein
MGTMIRPALCLGLSLAMGGCAFTDPYERAGVWRPSGSNEANLIAMVKTPSDLVQGVGDGLGNGQLAAAAIERLRADKVKPLPDSGLAQISLSGSGAGAGGTGTGAGTGGSAGPGGAP